MTNPVTLLELWCQLCGKVVLAGPPDPKDFPQWFVACEQCQDDYYWTSDGLNRRV